MQLDANYLTRTLRPILQDFCNDYNYIIPPYDYMSSIKITVVKNIPSGINLITHGQYDPTNNSILLATKVDTHRLLGTLLHELAHSVQKYNLGVAFGAVYKHQIALVGYTDCPLEQQARAATALLNYYDEDSIKNICDAILSMIDEELKQIKRRKEMLKQITGSRTKRYTDEPWYTTDEPWYTKGNKKAIQRQHQQRR